MCFWSISDHFCVNSLNATNEDYLIISFSLRSDHTFHGEYRSHSCVWLTFLYSYIEGVEVQRLQTSRRVSEHIDDEKSHSIAWLETFSWRARNDRKLQKRRPRTCKKTCFIFLCTAKSKELLKKEAAIVCSFFFEIMTSRREAGITSLQIPSYCQSIGRKMEAWTLQRSNTQRHLTLCLFDWCTPFITS